MPAKLKPADLEDAVRLYHAGEPIAEISRQLGVNVVSVYRRLNQAGVTLRRAEGRNPNRRIRLDCGDICARYLGGESEKSISETLKVSRKAIRRVIREADIEPRGRSAAMLERMSRTTKEERQNLTSAAHKAVRGRKATVEEREKRAKTVELTLSRAVPIESKLADWLIERGISVTQQRAVGKYNLDIAIDADSVAVEIFGGGWHSSGTHRATFHERTKYLLDLGWNVLIMWVDGRRYPLDINGCDQVVAFAEECRWSPSPRGKYRVILGDGQHPPARGSYFNSPADIERLGCGD